MFTKQLLLSPVIFYQNGFRDLVYQVSNTDDIGKSVLSHLSSQGFSIYEATLLKNYTIFVVDSMFKRVDKNDERFCAYAIVNHDVTKHFPFVGQDTGKKWLSACANDRKRPFAILQYLYVGHAYRRCGIASALVKFITRLSGMTGYGALHVENAAIESNHFLRALKFTRCKSSPEYHHCFNLE